MVALQGAKTILDFYGCGPAEPSLTIVKNVPSIITSPVGMDSTQPMLKIAQKIVDDLVAAANTRILFHHVRCAITIGECGKGGSCEHYLSVGYGSVNLCLAQCSISS